MKVEVFYKRHKLGGAGVSSSKAIHTPNSSCIDHCLPNTFFTSLVKYSKVVVLFPLIYLHKFSLYFVAFLILGLVAEIDPFTSLIKSLDFHDEICHSLAKYMQN